MVLMRTKIGLLSYGGIKVLCCHRLDVERYIHVEKQISRAVMT
jgi:hypothetical protein